MKIAKNIPMFISFVIPAVCLAFGFHPDMPRATLTIQVVDSAGIVVTNAQVGIGFDQGYNYKKHESVSANFKGLTGTNGLFTASAPMLNSKVRGSVEKEGCYRSSFEYAFKQDRQTLEWNPSHITNTVVLKKIKNPIPMYVKDIRLGIPKYEKPIGFDLDKGDWVAPYGRGIHTDLIAYAECDNPNDMLNRNFRMTVSFPNEKDGIIADGVYDSNSGSRLRSDYMAPEGGYEPEWLQVMHYTTQKKIEYNYDSNRKYYQRPVWENLRRFFCAHVLSEPDAQRPQC